MNKQNENNEQKMRRLSKTIKHAKYDNKKIGNTRNQEFVQIKIYMRE